MQAAGYTVSFVDYCENATTPGFLGQIAGVTNHEHRTVRIATRLKTKAQIADIAEHELRHITDRDWDCGSRDVFGRGGPD
jgi:hypothetical protein